jgi:hypothetical protein
MSKTSLSLPRLVLEKKKERKKKDKFTSMAQER